MRLTSISVLFSATIVLATGCSSAPVAGARYPEALFKSSPNFVDITRAPYNAANDGKTDVTAVIQKAISDLGGEPLKRKTIFFPPGTYLVSDTLRWEKTDAAGKKKRFSRVAFEGAGRDATILKLKDACEGFGNEKQPRAVLRTESINDSSYDGYNNEIWNLTVDVGQGNPGAVGLDWKVNNEGSVRNVRFNAGTGSGYTGIQMIRAYPGPGLLQNVQIDGFRYGMELRHTEYAMTMENIVLRGQGGCGILNRANNISIRGLKTEMAVPAVRNETGLVVLLDSQLSGGAAGSAAVENGGTLLARNLETTGYGQAIKSGATNVPGGQVAEWVSHPVQNLFGGQTTTLNLPVRETPAFEDNDFKNWVNVQDFGASFALADQAPAIQKALDFAAANGKSTVYFPPGQYICDGQLTVHGAVRQILGLGTVLRIRQKGPFAETAKPQPLIVVRDLTAEFVRIDGFYVRNYFDMVPGAIGISQETPKTLVLTNMMIDTGGAYRNSAGCGDLYIEDCCGGPWLFQQPGQKIWARQLNPENPGLKILNRGCTLWILGLKTEKSGTAVATSEGGRTEVLGGLLYPVRATDGSPAFSSIDSSISLTYATTAYVNVANDYASQVEETRGAQTKTLSRTMLPRHTLGSMMALYAGIQ